MAASKTPENSVTSDIIRKIHLTLANYRSGEDILEFLKSTEPIFMNEVNRFIQTEIDRMKSTLTEPQAMYIGSIIGASYIAGFLIAREVSHQMFSSHFNFKSPYRAKLNDSDIEKIIDNGIEGGRSYREIARVIEKTLTGKPPEKKGKNSKDPKKSKRLDLGNLE